MEILPTASARTAGYSTFKRGPTTVHCSLAGGTPGCPAVWALSPLIVKRITARNGSGSDVGGHGCRGWSLELTAAPKSRTLAGFNGEMTSMLTMVRSGAGFDMMV